MGDHCTEFLKGPVVDEGFLDFLHIGRFTQFEKFAGLKRL